VIDLETIEREISELEARQPSYKACERLSWLYIVRDHLREKIYPPDGKAAIKSALSGSEFLDAANGKPYEDVMRVVDEHLETIRLLYPKTWEGIIQRIKEL
jgi:hypothetical protein